MGVWGLAPKNGREAGRVPEGLHPEGGHISEASLATCERIIDRRLREVWNRRFPVCNVNKFVKVYLEIVI